MIASVLATDKQQRLKLPLEPYKS